MEKGSKDNSSVKGEWRALYSVSLRELVDAMNEEKVPCGNTQVFIDQYGRFACIYYEGVDHGGK